jgi:hypothetical protein
MDINNDELNRQLREVHAEQKGVEKKWVEALKRIFDPASGVSTAEKAKVLGVPGRRQFLQIGGVTVLGAAVLAACGSDKKDTAVSGTSAGSAAGSTAASSSSSSGAGNMDLVLARTAASIEALAIAAYKAAGDSGKVTDKTVGAVATLFSDHHKQHMDALNGVIKGAGGEEVTEPNAAIKKALVDPVTGDPALDQAKIVKLAYDLETAASQTYTFASTQLSTPQLRSTLMTIGGIEKRHASIIGFVALKLAPTGMGGLFPAAFESSENPLAAIPGAVLM